MLIGINLPDKYVSRWMELQREIGIDSFDGFIIYALGLGIQTLEAVNKTQGNIENVVQFDSNYYWPVDKR